MADIIDRPIRAGELPPGLRGDLDPSSLVLVTVRQVTANGFTETEEAAILTAETKAETENRPFRPAGEILAEIHAVVNEA